MSSSSAPIVPPDPADRDGPPAAERGAKPPPLPLEWTKIRRVGRKRPLEEDDGDGSRGGAGDGGSMIWCCPDPNCVRTAGTVGSGAATNRSAGDSGAGAIMEMNPAEKVGGTNAMRTSNDVAATNDNNTSKAATNVTLRGTAVLLLPDIDCDWFQGHFVPSAVGAAPGGGARPKPLGLLAVARTDTDDCLLCRDGGYREVDLTVFGPPSPSSSASDGRVGAGKRRRKVFERAVCTGGDMVRLTAGDSSDSAAGAAGKGGKDGGGGASFDGDRVLTGKRAAPYLVRYFSSVVRKLAEEEEEEEDGDNGGGVDGATTAAVAAEDEALLAERRALDALPDSAIVIGKMILTVPTKFLGGAFGGRVDFGDDSDDWMSD